MDAYPRTCCTAVSSAAIVRSRVRRRKATRSLPPAVCVTLDLSLSRTAYERLVAGFGVRDCLRCLLGRHDDVRDDNPRMRLA